VRDTPLAEAHIASFNRLSKIGTIFLTRGHATNEDLKLLQSVRFNGLSVESPFITKDGIALLTNQRALEMLSLGAVEEADSLVKEIGRISNLDALSS
jgi:hypothetical protein